MSNKIVDTEIKEVEVVEKLNLYQKIALLREKLINTKLKKSGRNTYSDYDYFELQDFIPTVIQLEKELDLLSVFSMNEDKATLTIIDTENETTLMFETPKADARGKAQLPIQALGSQHTYLRRYLYINYLSLSESDGVDGLPNDKKGSTEQPKGNATPKQIELIRNLYTEEEIETMLERLKKKGLMHLTLQEASKMIEARKK